MEANNEYAHWDDILNIKNRGISKINNQKQNTWNNFHDRTHA